MKWGIIILTFFLFAQTSGAEVLGEQVNGTREKIRQLEAEISKYEKELTKTERERNTLSNTIKTLDLTRKKLEAETKITESKVDTTTKEIGALESQIIEHSSEIDQRIENIADNLRELEVASAISPVSMILADGTMSDKIDKVYNLERLQDRVRADLIRLKRERERLSTDKTELERSRASMLSLKDRLGDQRRLTLDNISNKNKLLDQTKNKETNYRTLLERKIAQKEQFEKELREFESRLKSDINFGNLPSAGSGVLAWPLDSVHLTQQFGDTDFARNGGYNGRGHNGIDLRAAPGTAIKSADTGTVTGTGNTDLSCLGSSYGKWVLINHGNGLSTLYAHLSLIKVNAGENVSKGSLVGYSGNTGYSTGPHLHFTVYASEGVRITRLVKTDGTASKCGEMPVSPLNGYLNPLNYL